MGTFIDITGQKFGKLTVLRFTGENKDGSTLWECVCNCGNLTVVRSNSLRMGGTKSCGKCLRGKNEIGNRYGKLSVIRRSKNRKFTGSSAAAWVCKCDCGNEVIRAGSTLRNGGSDSCGCSWLERIKESNSLPKGEATKNHIIRIYKRSALIRGLEWNLEDSFVMNIVQQNCFYCDSEPFQVVQRKGRNINMLRNGIDRVDNNIGYIPENVVPCCKICNTAKSNLNEHQFLSWIESVYNHSIKNRGI